MDEFGRRNIAGGTDSRPGPRRCSFECLAVTTAASGLCDWASKAPSTRGPRHWVWMLQIVVCPTAARASGLPLQPDVHNAAERGRSADFGRARQPIFRPRPSQPCSFCGRRSGALGGRRLGSSRVPEGNLIAITLRRSRSGEASADISRGRLVDECAGELRAAAQTSDYCCVNRREGG